MSERRIIQAADRVSSPAATRDRAAAAERGSARLPAVPQQSGKRDHRGVVGREARAPAGAPGRGARPPTPRASRRSSEFAATPPESASGGSPRPRCTVSTRSTSAVTIARWKDARRSTRSGGSERPGRAARRRRRASRTPAASPSSGRRTRNRSSRRRRGRPEEGTGFRRRAPRCGRRPVRPDSRGPRGARPCRRPRPARRRASARSGRCGPPRPGRTRRGRRRRRARGTETRPAAPARRPARRNAEKRWPSRWLTPTSGMPRAKASAFPAERPTSSAPIRPGPAVAATRSSPSTSVPRSGERLLERDRQVLQVRARRDLRHDPAVGGVRRELRGDDVREHAALAVEDGDGRLVAGGFDAEDGITHGRTGKPLLPRGVARAGRRGRRRGATSGCSSQETRAAASCRASAARRRVRAEKPEGARAHELDESSPRPSAPAKLAKSRRASFVIGRSSTFACSPGERGGDLDLRQTPDDLCRVVVVDGATASRCRASSRAADRIAEESQNFIARSAAPPGAPREGSTRLLRS